MRAKCYLVENIFKLLPPFLRTSLVATGKNITNYIVTKKKEKQK